MPDAPRLSPSSRGRDLSLPPRNTIEIDDVIVAAPALKPRWTHSLVGRLGGKAYLDLRPRVWGHALVSVLAFLSLALLSPQVRGSVGAALRSRR